MASGVPTRRTTGRRVDENAPPVGRSKSVITTASTAVPKPSSIPTLKRAASSNATATTSSAPSKATQGTKRSALGEVTNGKGDKKDAERKPLLRTRSSQQPPPATTTSAIPVRTRAATARPLQDARPKTNIPAPKATRSRSTTASASASATKPAAAKADEEQPARKKRKTSSPALEGTPDIHDEALYDEDGKELVLSSGGRATLLRSPKQKAKDHGWTDLDLEDEGDPNMVSEYVVDAFNYMMSLEQQTMPHPEYMDKQAELHWKMRGVLMDWLIEVHQKFRLLPETLFIAVNLIDRFLSARVVSLVKLQLVGLTALFIAAKYEEVICPSVTHFLHMTDGGYGTEEILKAERYMLSTMDFDLSYPNPLHFLRRISKADGYDIQTRTLAKYLIEISCVEWRLIKYTPSMLAAAGMWLARLCLDRGEWSANLVHYSTYSQDELLECAQAMLDHLLDNEFSTTSSFYKKYASKKHMKSSIFIYTWAKEKWGARADLRGRELAVELDEMSEADDRSSTESSIPFDLEH